MIYHNALKESKYPSLFKTQNSKRRPVTLEEMRRAITLVNSSRPSKTVAVSLVRGLLEKGLFDFLTRQYQLAVERIVEGLHFPEGLES